VPPELPLAVTLEEALPVVAEPEVVEPEAFEPEAEEPPCVPRVVAPAEVPPELEEACPLALPGVPPLVPVALVAPVELAEWELGFPQPTRARTTHVATRRI
jgi:hypothetical protein